MRPRVQTPARIRVHLPGDSTPVPSAATYRGRRPGAMAGSWRRCPRRSGPSTPRCGAGQPLSESPASSCAPFPGLGRPRGCLEPNPAASRKRNYSSGWNPGYRASKHPGRRPAGSVSVAGRREPPIYSRSFCTHPTSKAQDFVGAVSRLFPPKLPHTHVQVHIGVARGWARSATPPAGSHAPDC